MNRLEIAYETHKRGFNCCAAVLLAFQDKLGMSEEQLLAIASGMGGGLRTGEVCGAVSGAVMALGAAAPHNVETGPAGKEYNTALTQEFQRRYIEKQGAVCCRDLKPVEAKYSCTALEGVEGNCNHYILTAVEILEELLKEENL